jgi:polyferredoxin
MGFWSIAMLVVATPVLTYFYGKRWYCSWVCGCGALAETAGDGFRHLSSKSQLAWTIERWTIYPILVVITVLTALLWYLDINPDPTLQTHVATANKIYGFVIGGLFSGVVGIGFYPILGSRVWCRFGCPMAAILGIMQKYMSRFRIETNGSQCISCGNCSTYCEMGIDVRSYAQEGKDIKRASCVGCGVCVSVCPRGVLRTGS